MNKINKNINPYTPSAISFKAKKQDTTVGKPYLEDQISSLYDKVSHTIEHDNFVGQEVSMDASKAFEDKNSVKNLTEYLGKVILKVFPDEENKGIRILSLNCQPTKSGKINIGNIKVINTLSIGTPADIFKRLSDKNFPEELQKIIIGAAEFMSRRPRV